mmetsp:Transcript_11646/g.19370  ORF Transcript_11646/g.19370 Transcript_11646/m.19370 type:complete len:126 (-) Transcript_11646:245-622(-)
MQDAHHGVLAVKTCCAIIATHASIHLSSLLPIGSLPELDTWSKRSRLWLYESLVTAVIYPWLEAHALWWGCASVSSYRTTAHHCVSAVFVAGQLSLEPAVFDLLHSRELALYRLLVVVVSFRCSL